MSLFELLSDLKRLDVEIWIEGDRLRYSAPEGCLSDSLRKRMRHHKIEIMAFLESVRASADSIPPPITPVPRDGELPLSFAQQRLWFLSQLEPDKPIYIVSGALRISGAIDRDALVRSVKEIMRRHETLRTSFKTVDGKPRLHIRPSIPLPLYFVPLSAASPAGREQEALKVACEEACKQFYLSEGPLFRVLVMPLEEEKHFLFVSMHHIITDGWSTGIFITELALLYDAFRRRQPSPLPELAVQYADFACWQRNWLQGKALERQLRYWKKKLSGLAPLLELPTDRPRPAMQSYAGGYYAFQLPSELAMRIEEFCTREHVSQFIMLLSIFKILLHRYTAETDICVGTPIANRNRREVEGLIGFFANTLALRSDLSGDPTFKELLQRVEKTALSGYARQDVPFEMVVDALRIERSLSHSPVFQVMFVMQSAPGGPVELSGLKLEPVALKNRTALYDLTLIVQKEGEQLRVDIEYDSHLFHASTIERMAEHFQNLLAGAIESPKRKIADLPLASESERRKIARLWNATDSEYPAGKCLHELFEDQALRNPDAEAVVFQDERLSYAELNQRANRLAHYLRIHGVGPESVVGIFLDRSIEMVVALLGVLKSGGAYVPLDPQLPMDRIAFMMEDIKLKMALSRSGLAENLPKGPWRALRLDADWPKIAAESHENVSSGAGPQNLAYVIYTSGSTGLPKGTLLAHQGVCNFIHSHIQALGVRAADTVLQFAAFNFDASVAEIFTALLGGARLLLMPHNKLFSADYFARQLRKEKVTMAILPPALLGVLENVELPDLRILISAGEACRSEIVQRWASDRRFYNGYGPTEATVGPLLYEVRDSAAEKGNVAIGRPLSNLKAYVLDKNSKPQPIGIAGELCIAGVGLARGYLNRPELSAERFIPDALSLEPGGRLYRTGDLARRRMDGNIEFLGRMDDQVKLRGFRIELNEIEEALGRHTEVKQAAVVVHEAAGGRKHLVAYLAANGKTHPSPAEIREHLRRELPEYMIPAIYVFLEKLPLTENGKVNRRALPMAEGEHPEREAGYVAPAGANEMKLAEIWQQLLGLKRVGANDNFFELGGDSILSIQVIARARQAGMQLTPRQLFEHPTIAGLAVLAGRVEQTKADQGEVIGPVPLTPIQRWFIEQNFTEPWHWNQSVMLEVRGPMTPEWLEQAVAKLLAHHDALRLRFEQRAGEWLQMNAAVGGETPCEWVDLSGFTTAERKRALEQKAAEVQGSFDIGRGPLLRVVYFDLGAGFDGRLLLVGHHLAVDGVSWRILLEDLQTVYGQLRRSQPVELAPKSSSYQYWARRLEEYAQCDELRRQLDYWLSVGRRGTEGVPLDFPGGLNTEASACSVDVVLSAEETRALVQDVPPAYGTEINDVLLAALAQALSRWTGRRVVQVALEGHGREDLFGEVDISRTVGWFTTVHPIVLDLGQAREPGAVLTAVKEQLRQVTQRGIGFGLLRYVCADEQARGQMAKAPPPQVAFNYLGQLDSALPLDGDFAPAFEFTGPQRSLSGLRTHLVEINGGISRGVLRMQWTYSANLHRRDSIEAVAADFIASLQRIIDHCLSPEAGGYTPSDFPDVDLNAHDIVALVSEINENS